MHLPRIASVDVEDIATVIALSNKPSFNPKHTSTGGEPSFTIVEFIMNPTVAPKFLTNIMHSRETAMVVKAMYNNIVCSQLLRHSFINTQNLIVHVFVTLLETTLIQIF